MSDSKDPSHPLNLQRRIGDALMEVGAMRPAGQRGRRPRAEARIDGIVRRLLVASGALFATLATLALVKSWFGLSAAVNPWALVVGVVSQLFALSALVVQTGGGLWMMLRFDTDQTLERQDEFAHDFSCAMSLLKFGRSVLGAADFLLAQAANRIERRQGLFFGSPDKLAVMSLLGGTLFAGKPFVESLDGAQKLVGRLGVSPYAWVTWAVVAALALTLGLAIGGMMLRVVNQRIAYQREVIALALASESW